MVQAELMQKPESIEGNWELRENKFLEVHSESCHCRGFSREMREKQTATSVHWWVAPKELAESLRSVVKGKQGFIAWIMTNVGTEAKSELE